MRPQAIVKKARCCAICDQPIPGHRRVCSLDCFRAYMSLVGKRANLLREIETGQRPRPASRPTSARPGSPQKIAVLRERFENGEELFHPQDAILLGGD